MSDLISRQAAITEIAKWMLEYGGENEKRERVALKHVANGIKNMPSAQPEQSIAEWQNDFREYINMLNIPRDDYNGIMEYINEVPSAQPEPINPCTICQEFDCTGCKFRRT